MIASIPYHPVQKAAQRALGQSSKWKIMHGSERAKNKEIEDLIKKSMLLKRETPVNFDTKPASREE